MRAMSGTLSPPADRRRHPRVALVAQAQLSSMGEVHLLEVGNASRTGLFLCGAPPLHPDLRLDAVVEITVTQLDHPESAGVSFAARVVRVQPDGDCPGFGLAVELIDEQSAHVLDSLLGAEITEED